MSLPNPAQATGVVDPTTFGRDWAARVLTPGPLTESDRVQVTGAIRRCYLWVGLRPPRTVIWALSPEQADRYRVGDEQLIAAVTARRSGVPGWSAPGRYLSRFLCPPVAAVMTAAVAAWLGLTAPALVLVGYVTLFAWLPAVVLLGAYLVLARHLLAPRRAAVALAGASRSFDRKARRTRRSGIVDQTIGLAFAAGFLAVLWVGLYPVRRWPGRWMLPVAQPVWTVGLALGAGVGAVAGGVGGWRWARQWLAARPRRLIRPVESAIRSRAVWLMPRSSARASAVDDGARAAGQAAAEADLVTATMRRPVPPRTLAEWAYRTLSAPPLRRQWPARRLLSAHEVAARVSWQPMRRVALVLEPPVEVHSAPSGLHRLDGPAVVWADGSAWFYLNGVRVPRRPDVTDWTAQEIHEVANSETRRVMIEAIGWERYIRSAELAFVASAPDPANPPHRLSLYETADGIDDGCRLLVMTNGSPDRSGAPRRYAEYVPDHFGDPVEAAAWQYGVPVETYRQLERRT